MIKQLAFAARPILEIPVIRRTRRNHGLEHATITVLSGRVRGVRLAGRSTDSGFTVLGDVSTEQVESAAHEALRRMRGGEHYLALHPGCGTNLVTTGVLTTLAGMMGVSTTSRRSLWDRFPLILVLMLIALIVAQPLGMALQQHFTTHGDPGDLEILHVSRSRVSIPFAGTLTVHRVDTQNG